MALCGSVGTTCWSRQRASHLQVKQNGHEWHFLSVCYGLNLCCKVFTSGRGTHKDQKQAPESHVVQDLMVVLLLQGYDVSQEEVERLMGRIDFDKNGNIDFEEFTTGLLDWRAVSVQIERV